MKMRWVLGGVMLLGVVVWGVFGGDGRIGGEMRQEVYVWQRVWDGDVVEGVRKRARWFDGVRVSAAELAVEGGVRAGVDYAVLAGTGKRVWLVVRMGSEFGGKLGEAGILGRVEVEMRGLLEAAEEAGCEVAGIEVDYDCATSRLGEYAGFVREMRGRIGDVEWSVTALPSWLEDAGEFEALVREVGQYVLQVHSLELPEKGRRDLWFCDPGRARVAVERAGEIGVAFLVALPTYSSVVVFDENDAVVDVVSEDLAKVGGDGVLVRSDPVAMAGLVAQWTGNRPAAMGGVVWFRLPVAGDVRNWKPETLEAVMTGVAPAGWLSGDVEVGEDGLVKVVVRNAGVGEAVMAEAVVVSWVSGELVASDGLGGFREVTVGGERRVVFRGGPGGVLRAGESSVVGWLRGLDLEGIEVGLDQL